MGMRLWLALTASALIVTGCSGTSAQERLSALIGQKPADQLTAMERTKARFKALQVLEQCANCWVTGGGNGNTAASSCGDAKFGFVALEGDIATTTDDSGRLNFWWEKDFHINGPVTDTRCFEVHEGPNGQASGTIQFEGDVAPGPSNGDIPTTNSDPIPVRYRVTVIDDAEPNVDDKLSIELLNTAGEVIWSYNCTSADGNIQLHDPRIAQH